MIRSNRETNSQVHSTREEIKFADQTGQRKLDILSKVASDKSESRSSSEEGQEVLIRDRHLPRQTQDLSLRREAQSDFNYKPKRNPFCSRCRNHGKSAQVKGHKRHCEYRDCQCEGCKLVECRQMVSAAQIKRRRNQKQDEECGRHIEISPPVLKRDLDNDPVTLIAKTLIGSSDNNGPLGSPASLHKSISSTLLTATTGGNVQGLKPLSSLTDNGSSYFSSHSKHPLQHHTHNGDIGPLHASTTIVDSYQHHYNDVTSNLYSTLNHHQSPSSFHHSNENDHQNSHASDGLGLRPSNGAALSSNAFNLFRPPATSASVMSAASISASLEQNQQLLAQTAAQPKNITSLGVSNDAKSLTTREQLTLIEQIYYQCGHLAIFAWLKAENFNLDKIRDLMETSRKSYEDLLKQLNLDNGFKNSDTKTEGEEQGRVGSELTSGSRRNSNNSGIEPGFNGEDTRRASMNNHHLNTMSILSTNPYSAAYSNQVGPLTNAMMASSVHDNQSVVAGSRTAAHNVTSMSTSGTTNLARLHNNDHLFLRQPIHNHLHPNLLQQGLIWPGYGLISKSPNDDTSPTSNQHLLHSQLFPQFMHQQLLAQQAAANSQQQLGHHSSSGATGTSITNKDCSSG